jgi:hypothetical protein
MIYPGIFLLSFSSLSFEILMARIFSITQWNHLSFMVISIALLGSAACGTLCSILDSKITGWGKKIADPDIVDILIIGYALLTLSVIFIMSRTPFDYFRLPFEPVHAGYLFLLYIAAAAPFFITGIAVLGGYAAFPEKSGHVYFASMAGSACGAVFPIPFLPILGEAEAAIVATVFPLLLPIMRILRFFHGRSGKIPAPVKPRIRNLLPFFSAGTILVFAVYSTFLSESRLFSINPSVYKALSQLLKYPDTRIRSSNSSIQGRIDTVESDYIRYAPGLSLKFTGSLPRQWSAFRDGDHPFTFFEAARQNPFEFTSYSLSFAGYVLCPTPNRILIITQGGGSAIPTALTSSASEIIVVEQNPDLARQVKSHYRLPVVVENPRSFLSRNQLKFDIIHIENWGASLLGAAALSQEYLLTREAFSGYLSSLNPKGILMISRRIRLPPSDMVRLWATAFEALKSLGHMNPESHITILRNWDTFILLVSQNPLDVDPRLIDFSTRLNFDFVYSFPPHPELSNRFNRFDQPYHFQILKEAEAAYQNHDSERFHGRSLLDVRPQSDDRPFPERFFKWPNIRLIYNAMGSRFFSLFMSGEFMVAVVFFEASVITILLFFFSVAFLPKIEKKPGSACLFYFFFLGSGFMFLELFFIKAFTLLFGDPILSFTAVISLLLIFSGIGGMISQKLSTVGIQAGFAMIPGLFAFLFLILDDLIQVILPLGLMYRSLFCVLLLIPAGILIGFPFPLGMRRVAKTPLHHAHAWLINGCASVLTSILSIQIAVSFGIKTLLILSGGSYFLAWVCWIFEQRKSEFERSFQETGSTP